MPQDQDHRLRIYVLEPRAVDRLLRGELRPAGDAMPDDARVVGAWIDHYRNPMTIMLKVHSESFPDIPLGALVPEFCGPWEVTPR